MKGITDGSEFAFQGSKVINNAFKDIAVNDAKIDAELKKGADYQYATLEDSMDKRGRWFNGTFGSEGQRTVAGAGTAKEGGEVVNVDSTLLAKLIAAGADIEIL